MKKNIKKFLKKKKTYLKNLLDTIIPTSSTDENNSKTIFFIAYPMYIDHFFTCLINNKITSYIKPYQCLIHIEDIAYFIRFFNSKVNNKSMKIL